MGEQWTSRRPILFWGAPVPSYFGGITCRFHQRRHHAFDLHAPESAGEQPVHNLAADADTQNALKQRLAARAER